MLFIYSYKKFKKEKEMQVIVPVFVLSTVRHEDLAPCCRQGQQQLGVSFPWWLVPQ